PRSPGGGGAGHWRGCERDACARSGRCRSLTALILAALRRRRGRTVRPQATGTPHGSAARSRNVHRPSLPPSTAQPVRSSQLHPDLVDEAPTPVFTGFERAHDRVLRRVKVLGRVLVLGIVAAADVAAGPAKAQMNPGIAHGEAFLTAG